MQNTCKLKVQILLFTEKANSHKIMGKGQNYKFHNVENQKEHRKSWRRSLHRKDL